MPKRCQSASRAARRQRVDNLLHEAEHKAGLHNTHKLYAIIRQIAPKHPFRRVKTYGEEGEILSREAEAERLRTHFANIFQGEPRTTDLTSGLFCAAIGPGRKPSKAAVVKDLVLPMCRCRPVRECSSHITLKGIELRGLLGHSFRQGILVNSSALHRPAMRCPAIIKSEFKRLVQARLPPGSNRKLVNGAAAPHLLYGLVSPNKHIINLSVAPLM